MTGDERCSSMTGEELLPADARRAAIVGGQVIPETLSEAELRLAELGAALRSPANDAELAGMAVAVAAFTSAARPRGARHVRKTRSLTAVGAGVAAVVFLGGAAAAAATGHLPDSLQRIAHATLGAPRPAIDRSHAQQIQPDGVSASEGDRSASPTDAATDAGHRPGVAPGHSSSRGGQPVPSAGAVGLSAFGMCQAWTAMGTDANPESAFGRSLSRLAGPSGVKVYCTHLLALSVPGPSGRASAAPSGRPTPRPTSSASPGPAAGSPPPTPAGMHVALSQPTGHPSRTPSNG